MKFLHSIRFATQGFVYAFCLGNNFRIQIMLSALGVAAGVCFNIPTFEWLIVMINISLVLVLEIINTAIEEICNFISPQKNKAIGRIKDLAAAAVLFAAVIAAISGTLIFLPHLIQLINS